MLGDHVLGHAHLDAEHHVGVLGHRPGGRVDAARNRCCRAPAPGSRRARYWRCARRRRAACASARRCSGGRRRNCWRRRRPPTRRWSCIGAPPARRPECRSPSRTGRRANAGRSARASPACPTASSTRCARAAGMSASTASITPKRMPMSRLPRSDWLGSSTSPPLITRSNLSFGPMAARAGPAAAASANAPAVARKSRRDVIDMTHLPMQPPFGRAGWCARGDARVNSRCGAACGRRVRNQRAATVMISTL